MHVLSRWVPITLTSSNAPVSAAVPESNAATPQGYEVDDPVEWCRHINAFAASEVYMPSTYMSLSVGAFTNAYLQILLSIQVRSFKLYTQKYLEVLTEEIVRRKCAIHTKLGITDVSPYSAKQLADFYASGEYKRKLTSHIVLCGRYNFCWNLVFFQAKITECTT